MLLQWLANVLWLAEMPVSTNDMQAKRLHAKARKHFAGRLPELRSGMLQCKTGNFKMSHDCLWYRSDYPWVSFTALPEDVADYFCLVFYWNPLVTHSAPLMTPVFLSHA